jgi:hypothetical protein
MNKTISINPDLFKLANNKKTSRKKREKAEKKDIKVKSPQNEKQKNKLIRRQHILKRLREQQEKNYNKLIQESKPVKQNNKSANSSFNNDFSESVEYFNNLSIKNKEKESHNYTLKNYQSNKSNGGVLNNQLDIHPVTNGLDINDKNEIHLSKPVIDNVSTPVWGCLKNGNLPTFRNWKNSTQKINNSEEEEEEDNFKKEVRSKMKYMKEDEEIQPKLNLIKKQKRTVKRTHKVGRSSVFSKIGVLVSNKTIRNNVINKTQEIKQVPIEEVRRYLVKKGLIKIGSIAPNDVLRKMYETSNLICGDLENHNVENLLHNYLHP